MRTKNRSFLLMFLLCVVISPLHAQVKSIPQMDKCVDSGLKDESPEMQKQLKDFWADFQNSIRAGRWSMIAQKQVQLPLPVATANKRFTVRSVQEFVNLHDTILPGNIQEFILKTDSSCISRVGDKGFSIGEGQLWFDQFADGKIRIFTVTSILYSK